MIELARRALEAPALLAGAWRRARTALRRRRLAEMILTIAREELGKGETEGQNLGPDIDRYAAACGWPPGRGIAWCAAFASYCYVEACRRLRWSRYDVAHVGARKLAERVVAAGGERIDLPEPGCLVLLERGGPGGSAHVRICEAFDGDGTYDSIEGNSGPRVRRATYPVHEGRLLGYYRWPVA